MTATIDNKATVCPRLMNGFVFKSVFGTDLQKCKRLIEITLDTKIEHVEFVEPEHDLDVLPKSRAGRLDLYVVDDQGRCYDVEVQAESNNNEIFRARYYQSLIDITQLRKGMPVDELPESVVIFICDFDPFDDDLRWYDCRTTCIQTGDVMQDGRRLVLLNARGTKGAVSRSLDAFCDMWQARRL